MKMNILSLTRNTSMPPVNKSKAPANKSKAPANKSKAAKSTKAGKSATLSEKEKLKKQAKYLGVENKHFKDGVSYSNATIPELKRVIRNAKKRRNALIAGTMLAPGIAVSAVGIGAHVGAKKLRQRKLVQDIIRNNELSERDQYALVKGDEIIRKLPKAIRDDPTKWKDHLHPVELYLAKVAKDFLFDGKQKRGMNEYRQKVEKQRAKKHKK